MLPYVHCRLATCVRLNHCSLYSDRLPPPLLLLSSTLLLFRPHLLQCCEGDRIFEILQQLSMSAWRWLLTHFLVHGSCTANIHLNMQDRFNHWKLDLYIWHGWIEDLLWPANYIIEWTGTQQRQEQEERIRRSIKLSKGIITRCTCM